MAVSENNFLLLQLNRFFYNMTSKKLLQLIENPNELFLFPEQELQDLSEKYPYCQNLVLLSTFKKQWSNEKQFKKQEELAATYSIDRSFLRILVLKNGQHKFELPENSGNAISDDQTIFFDDSEVIEEEIIEFPSLTKLEKDIESIPIPEPKINILEEKQPSNTVEWNHISSIEELETPKEIEIVKETNIRVKPKEEEPKIIKKSKIEQEVIKKEEPTEVKEHVPDLTEDEILLQKMKVLEAELAVIKSKLKLSAAPKKQKVKTKPIPKTAKRSLEKSDSIISETLANILEKQGYFKRSKKMYEQLSLIFPEKSGFFAEKIKNLQNLITNKK